jgi:glycosyltransferase involved in cell wall biosynthesis
MKILLINKFLYPAGGDAISTINTKELLEKKGHQVIMWGMAHPLNPVYPWKDYFVSYVDFNAPMGIKEKLNSALRVIYSFEAKNKIKQLIEKVKPDIAHLNNFAHQISPSIIDVLKKRHIPIVMTLHDYKLVCASYTLLRNGHLCELCKKRRYYWCLLTRCNKNSFLKSLAATIEMYLHHKILHLYDEINTLISPSLFLKDKFRQMGVKRDIEYLPNFITFQDYEAHCQYRQNSIAYFGRLAQEKGLFTLINAVKDIKSISLKIIGEGPLEKALKSKVQNERIENVFFLGRKSGRDLMNELERSLEGQGFEP